MKLLLFITIFISILLPAARAQDKPLPKELKPFIAEGYETLGWAEGDLNGDGRKDAVLVLKQPGEDTVEVKNLENIPRPLLVLTRGADGKLKQAVRNDDIVLCRQCGGIFGDPWEGVSITKGQLLLDFYGGSNWRWAIHYAFTWNAAQNDWLLLQERQTTYHTSSPDKAFTETIPGTEVLRPHLSRFGAAFPDCTSKWKVTAAKTFFYSQPVLGSKPRKGYLVKGNVAECIRELKNFVKVYFSNDSGTSTEGYLLKKDLVVAPGTAE